MFQTRVFQEIDDPFLKSEWERLEHEGRAFPQSTYHWCATWWKHLSGRRKLHVIMIVDEQNKAVVIAPMCIERHWGVRVLRSFPVHFGDFYTFIASPNGASESAYGLLTQYLLSNKCWQWVRIEQVPEHSDLRHHLDRAAFPRKRMTGCVIASFPEHDWEEYLAGLKASMRKNIRRRQRHIDEECEVTFECVRDAERFSALYPEMQTIYSERLSHIRPKTATPRIHALRQAIDGCYRRGNAASFCLFLNRHLAAFSVGFLHNKTYYNWYSSANTNLRGYHPAVMINAYVIQSLIRDHYDRMNFMAGDYEWKLDWSPDQRIESNFLYSSPATNLTARLLNWYHHRLRDRLKDGYHRMAKYPIMQAAFRRLTWLRERLAAER
jgi:CelD/BcsL family acetyltransferase involved in cellulose biosynthesis